MARSLFDLENEILSKIGKEYTINPETHQIVKRSDLIGKIITKLRLNREYTQREISEGIGIAQQTYAGYEKGRHEPNVEILIRLADIYGVSMDFITGRYISTSDHIIKEKVMEDLIEHEETGKAEDTEEILKLYEYRQRGKYNRAKKK